MANRLRRRTSDQTVLGSNPAVAAALSKGALKKKIAPTATKKERGGGSANAPHCARSASDRAPFLQMLRMRLELLIWRQRLNMLKQACSRHLRW